MIDNETADVISSLARAVDEALPSLTATALSSRTEKANATLRLAIGARQKFHDYCIALIGEADPFPESWELAKQAYEITKKYKVWKISPCGLNKTVPGTPWTGRANSIILCGQDCGSLWKYQYLIELVGVYDSAIQANMERDYLLSKRIEAAIEDEKFIVIDKIEAETFWAEYDAAYKQRGAE